jgi:colanic acid biosynthesis glycosyl transferase WcaI
MRILVLCPHFAPDVAPTGEVMSRIVVELAARGHRVDVVTALPWYRDHAIEPGWDGQLVRTESTEWGRIVRVHPFPTNKRNIPARALAFGGFTAMVAAVGAADRPAPDVVLSMSPPLTLGVAGWSIARLRRVPFVFNIQDVFPDVAIELGHLKGDRVIAAARWLERVTYQRADAVTVLSDDLADNVRSKIAGKPPSSLAVTGPRVEVIPNFVDTEWIRPSAKENSYRRDHALSGRRVVMYAGNVGLSQALDLLIDAAVDLADEPDVVFVINGGGSGRAELERRARPLTNVIFVDMQPKARLPEVLAAADVHVVPLKAGLARSSVPSKLYSILAAGRPIVAAVDPGTEVARTIELAGAGIAVSPEDPEGFIKALRRMLDTEADRVEMGAAGRRFVEGWASPAAVAEAYEDLFEAVRVQRHRGGG